MKKKWILSHVLCVIGLAGCSDEPPKSLLSEKDALECVGGVNGGVADYKGEREYFQDLDYDKWRDKCLHHQIALEAFVEGGGWEDEFTVMLSQPYTGRSTYDEIMFTVHKPKSLQKNFSTRDKVLVNGIIRGSNYSGAKVVATVIEKMELTEEEIETSKRDSSDAAFFRRAAEARSRAIIETDQALTKYAQNERKKLLERAVNHTTSNNGGVRVDLFTMGDGSVHLCKTTFPGPVFSCTVR